MDLTQVSIPLVAALTGGLILVSAVGSYFATVFALRGEIKLLWQRVTALEGAEQKDTELRIANLEKQLSEVLSHANVSDWNRWRATVDGRLTSLEKPQ